jgi:hypothetical protein
MNGWSRQGWPPIAALLVVFLLWGGCFIRRSSFEEGGRRVFCLWDDAMIAMTYARNLCEGKGLNWAREGDPVEGFTSPLWLALMIPVNALPVALGWRSLLVQPATGRVFPDRRLPARPAAQDHAPSRLLRPWRALVAGRFPEGPAAGPGVIAARVHSAALSGTISRARRCAAAA